MKYFIATAALAVFAAGTEQLEHLWKKSPIYMQELGCAADEPEWECIMRPILERMNKRVNKVEDEWTYEQRRELTDLNIELEAAKTEHVEAQRKASIASCAHDKEMHMRELYRCEMRALRLYTGGMTSYPGAWS